ncbi:MAG TPA: ABC transporter permease [Desulfobulbus sp.]|nr:ABC transporter permease [Desulfobulbus sp.]
MNPSSRENDLPSRAAWPRLLFIPALATVLVCLLLLALGMSPPAIGRALGSGSLGSWLKFSHVLSVWSPLLLCSCGLLFTFRAGLWNIGIEGQVIVGAIGCTAVLRLWDGFLPPSVLLPLALAAGGLAGGLWGILAGELRNRGGVNEIFGGLGLNFVAQGLIIWLIFGPWKRAGIASMSGTDLLSPRFWLTTPPGWRVAPVALAVAVLALAVTILLLDRTRFGLHLRAVGANPGAARLFGIRPDRVSMRAMLLAGMLAGLAGSLQVTAVYHRLIPAISSGYGYLGLLVVMLANYRSPAVPLIALFFACLVTGSIQLPITLQIDSSLAGVIQGAFVLSALLVHGLRRGKD